MKKAFLYLFLLGFVSANAQDDVYYSPSNDNGSWQDQNSTQQNNSDYNQNSSTDYNTTTTDQTDGYGNNGAGRFDSPDQTTTTQDENGNTYITNNYYDYDDENYDFQYSSRLRRYYAPVSNVGFWDSWYTNYYFYSYDPWNWGVNLYATAPCYQWGWNRPWRNRSFVVYDPWYDPWYAWNGWGCNVVVYNPGWYQPFGWNTYAYNSCGGWNNGWGWGNGWNNGWNNGWCGNTGWNNYWNGYSNGYYDGYWNGWNDANSTAWYDWNGPWRMQKGETTTASPVTYNSGNSIESRKGGLVASNEIIPREGITKPFTPVSNTTSPTSINGVDRKDPSSINNTSTRPGTSRADEFSTRPTQPSNGNSPVRKDPSSIQPGSTRSESISERNNTPQPQSTNPKWDKGNQAEQLGGSSTTVRPRENGNVNTIERNGPARESISQPNNGTVRPQQPQAINPQPQPQPQQPVRQQPQNQNNDFYRQQPSRGNVAPQPQSQPQPQPQQPVRQQPQNQNNDFYRQQPSRGNVAPQQQSQPQPQPQQPVRQQPQNQNNDFYRQQPQPERPRQDFQNRQEMQPRPEARPRQEMQPRQEQPRQQVQPRQESRPRMDVQPRQQMEQRSIEPRQQPRMERPQQNLGGGQNSPQRSSPKRGF